MAYVDERIAKLTLDSDDFKKNLLDLQKTIKSLDKSMQNLGSIKVDTKSAVKSMGDMDKSTKTATKNMADSFNEVQKSVDSLDKKTSKSMDTKGFVDGFTKMQTASNKSMDDMTKGFEKGSMRQRSAINKVVDGVGNLSTRLKDVSLDTLSKSVQSIEAQVQKSFTMMDMVVANFVTSAIQKVMSFSRQFTRGMTDGLNEYTQKLTSVQTILSNTEWAGTTMNDVTAALEELNQYADKTIYNFQDMTRNIGTFTAAGVKLDTANTAIKGLGNLAAASGASAQDASRVMYQLSQAIAAGTIRLQDWNSVVNGNMGGKLFQDALKKSAKEMGVVVDQTKSFRDSLQSGWLTTEVLMKTLTEFSTNQSMLDAATKVKSFNQLVETTQEAIGSSWAMTWETIFGNFEQAREHWTSIMQSIESLMSNPFRIKLSDGSFKELDTFRNAVASVWADLGGRDAMFGILKNAIDNVSKAIGAFREGFSKALGGPEKFGSVLANITKGLESFTKKLEPTTAQLNLFREIGGAVANTMQIIGAVMSVVGNVLAGAGKYIMEFVKGLSDGLGGFDNATEGIKNAVFAVRDFLGEIKLGQGFLDMFAAIGDTIGTVFLVAGRIIRAFGSIIGAAIPTSVFEFLSVSLSTIAEKLRIFNAYIRDATAVSFDFSFITDGMNTIVSALMRIQPVKAVVDGVATAFNVLKDALSAWLKPANRTEEQMARLNDRFDKMKTAFDKIKEVITTVGGYIAAALRPVIDTIKELSLTDIMHGVLTYGLIYLVKLVKQLHGIVPKIKEMFFSEDLGDKAKGGIAGIIDSIQKSLESFVRSIDIVAMATIAASMVALAISIKTLSSIDNWGDVAKGLGTLAIGLTIFMDSFNFFLMNQKDVKARLSVIPQMIALLHGLNELVDMIVKLAGVDWNGIAKGLVGISGVAFLLLTATIFFNEIEMNTGIMSRVMVMALSLAVVAKSFEGLAKLSWEQMGVGITSLASIVVLTILLVKSLDMIYISPKTALSISMVMVSLTSLSRSMEKLSRIPFDQLSIGLLGMVGSVTVMSMLVSMMDQIKIKKDTALNIATFLIAMNVLVGITKRIADMDAESLAKGLVGFLGVMAGLTLMIDAIGRIRIGNRVQLTMLSLGVLVTAISKSMVPLAKLSWGDMAKGLITMGATFSILLTSLMVLNKMTETIKGVESLAIGLLTLTLLAGVVKRVAEPFILLGKMNWGDIIKASLSLGTVIYGLMMAAVYAKGALSGVATLVLLSAALLPIALSLKLVSGIKIDDIVKGIVAIAGGLAILVGTAMLMNSLGLPAILMSLVLPITMAALAAVGFAAAFALLQASITSLGNKSPDDIKKAISGFGVALVELTKLVPEMVNFVAQFIYELIRQIPTLLTELFEALVKGMDILARYLPQIIEKLRPILQTLVNKLGPVLDEVDWKRVGLSLSSNVLKLFAGLIKGIAIFTGPILEVVSQVFAAVLTALGGFFQGVLPVLSGLIEAVTPIVINLQNAIVEIVKASMDAAPVIISAFAVAMEMLQPFFVLVADLLKYIVDAMVQIYPLVGPTVEMVLTALSTLTEALGVGLTSVVNSLSTLLIGTLDSLGSGIIGILTAIGDAIVGTGNALASMVDAIASVLNAIAEVISSVGNVISDVITAIADGISGVLDSIAGVVRSFGESALMAGQGIKALAEGIAIITKLNLADMAASLIAVGDGVKKLLDVFTNADRTGVESIRIIGESISLLVNSAANAGTKLTELMNALIVFRDSAPSVQPAFDAIKNALSSLSTDESINMDNIVVQIGNIGRALTSLSISSQVSITSIRIGLISLASTMSGAMSNAVNSMANAVSNGFSRLAGVIQNKGKEAEEAAVYVGTMIGAGIEKGLLKSLSGVEKAAKRIIDAAAKAAKAKAKIKSPSRLFEGEVGHWIGMGIASGILKTAGYVSDAVTSVIDTGQYAVTSMTDKVEELLNATVDGIDTSVVVTAELDDTQLTALENLSYATNVGVGIPTGVPLPSYSDGMTEAQAQTVTNKTYNINATTNKPNDIVTALRTHEFLHGE